MGGAFVILISIQLLLLAYSMFIAGASGLSHKIHSGLVLFLSFVLIALVVWTFPDFYVFYLIQSVVFIGNAFILYHYYGRRTPNKRVKKT